MVDNSTTTVDYLHSPGYRYNLTPSQTLALFKLWRRFLRLCEITSHSSDSIDADASQPPTSASRSSSDSLRRGFGRKHRAAASEPVPQQSSAPNSHEHLAQQTADSSDPKHVPKHDKLKEHLRHLEESNEMQAFLLNHGGAALRTEFWAIVKGEHPDAYMLRCLRARKWDVDRALAIIGSTCAFRVQYKISNIMKEAELGLTRTRGGFNIMNNGISYTYGATAAGEPVYFIEVGSHYSSNQTAEELKRGVILLQESLSILMPPPVERKVVIFNLNNFGIRNMDWSIVLFMAKTMESFYPETLARVYVHGAPWIFKPIWSILRPLLDPVVRDKVRLTWKVEELGDHVPSHHLPKDSMHGQLDWSFTYPLPKEDENDVQKDTQMAEELASLYRNACMEFEFATRALARAYGDASLSDAKGRGIRPKFGRNTNEDGDNIHDDWEPEGVASLRANRDILATRVRVAWLKLRPYVMGTLKYDRWGVLDRQGVIRWKYETADGRHEEQVLGEGTSLSVLERNLAELDAINSHTKNASSSAKVHASRSRLDDGTSRRRQNGSEASKVNGQHGVDAVQGAHHGHSKAAVPSSKEPIGSKPPTADSAANDHPEAGSDAEADGRPSSVALTALSKPDSTTDSTFEEPIPIHPSQMQKMGGAARDGDLEIVEIAK
ncbi:related to CSR1 - phosphatidylinositol transfer protein [Melanopsichium pennsylvanicum]|uniref:Related to CSR1 - phosphatidylinositol transfer protein n=2 Tax=Melanopsichium pennsylvanicum TaxID=63383 RepID=A0AAJ5C4S8_9BASI|nr:related to CSR1-phosphatidylinositol transfer protein [Melanopsichium pennsylvanicum 4]SNX84016.1 related to CSR1 - phosphatidylinositol transfer protein [Melanopsichium pennsylvanicum]